jgi:uncharacterized membrane protein
MPGWLITIIIVTVVAIIMVLAVIGLIIKLVSTANKHEDTDSSDHVS